MGIRRAGGLIVVAGSPSEPDGAEPTPVSSSSFDDSVSVSSWLAQLANTVMYGFSPLAMLGDGDTPSTGGSAGPSREGRVTPEFWSNADITRCDRAPTSVTPDSPVKFRKAGQGLSVGGGGVGADGVVVELTPVLAIPLTIPAKLGIVLSELTMLSKLPALVLVADVGVEAELNGAFAVPAKLGMLAVILLVMLSMDGGAEGADGAAGGGAEPPM